MPQYRRLRVPGGTYFFTLVTFHRRPILTSELGRACLRDAIDSVRKTRPFDIDAFVLLPDHLHVMWTLPIDDVDFSTRWRRIKELFTRAWRESGGSILGVSESQTGKGNRGIWQQRFWEHTIRDDDDYAAHADYIHYNPAKHALVRCPHEWRYSSFHRFVAEGTYSRDWACQCDGRDPVVPDLSTISKSVGE